MNIYNNTKNENIFYNIHHFEWDKEVNTITADLDKLYAMGGVYKL